MAGTMFQFIAFIRFGFDQLSLIPVNWTRSGKVVNDLVVLGYMQIKSSNYTFRRLRLWIYTS